MAMRFAGEPAGPSPGCYTLGVIDRPQDQLSILKLVTGRLDETGIAYMITGSIASGHYGHPRMTRDIDIVVELTPADAPRLAAALGDEFGADPDRMRDAIARRRLFNVIHREAIVKVDFVVRKDTPYLPGGGVPTTTPRAGGRTSALDGHA